MAVITSKGHTVQSKHAGITVSIPDGTLRCEEGEVELLIQTYSNGPFEFPAGYQPVSPAYLVEPSRRVQLQKGVTVDTPLH